MATPQEPYFLRRARARFSSGDDALIDSMAEKGRAPSIGYGPHGPYVRGFRSRPGAPYASGDATLSLTDGAGDRPLGGGISDQGAWDRYFHPSSNAERDKGYSRIPPEWGNYFDQHPAEDPRRNGGRFDPDFYRSTPRDIDPGMTKEPSGPPPVMFPVPKGSTVEDWRRGGKKAPSAPGAAEGGVEVVPLVQPGPAGTGYGAPPSAPPIRPPAGTGYGPPISTLLAPASAPGATAMPQAAPAGPAYTPSATYLGHAQSQTEQWLSPSGEEMAPPKPGQPAGVGSSFFSNYGFGFSTPRQDYYRRRLDRMGTPSLRISRPI